MMMMKKKKERKKCIGILKCPGSFDYGVMFSSILEKHQFATKIFDCEAGELPSRHEDFDGFIITGSSASAYDDVDWVKGLISKTRELIEKKCRVVGICFGHQVVAQAFCPGEVTKNPNGWELGMCSFTLDFYSRSLNRVVQRLRLLFVLEYCKREWRSFVAEHSFDRSLLSFDPLHEPISIS